jgi:hypothetical protein
LNGVPTNGGKDGLLCRNQTAGDHPCLESPGNAHENKLIGVDRAALAASPSGRDNGVWRVGGDAGNKKPPGQGRPTLSVAARLLPNHAGNRTLARSMQDKHGKITKP